MLLQEKFQLLQDNIKKKGSVAIAFLGGVDSTFLVRIAHEVLGNKLVAVTATTSTYPERELKEANLTKADIRVLSEEEKTV